MAFSRRRFLQHSAMAAAACAAAPLPGWGRGVNKPAGQGAPAQAHQATPPKFPPAQLTPGAMDALGHMSRQDFVQAIGEAFQVTPGSPKASPVFLRLLAVNDLPALAPVNPASMAVSPRPSTPVVTTGFMLQFAGTGTRPLAQGTYVFQHPVLGQFALFVVPGNGPQQTCTGVINWLGTSSAQVFQKR